MSAHIGLCIHMYRPLTKLFSCTCQDGMHFHGSKWHFPFRIIPLKMHGGGNIAVLYFKDDILFYFTGPKGIINVAGVTGPIAKNKPAPGGPQAGSGIITSICIYLQGLRL